MRCVNKVILVGNLTRDPEMRQTTSGQSIVTFGLATNREWMTKDGRKMASGEYHELAAWAKLGEICYHYLKKGKLIYAEGYLKTRSKVMPDGTKKFRTEIVLQDMIMLEKRAKETEEESRKILAPSPAEGSNGESKTPMETSDEPDSAGSDDIFEG